MIYRERILRALLSVSKYAICVFIEAKLCAITDQQAETETHTHTHTRVGTEMWVDAPTDGYTYLGTSPISGAMYLSGRGNLSKGGHTKSFFFSFFFSLSSLERGKKRERKYEKKVRKKKEMG